ncbi:MAG: PAS domain-containing protein, partial [Pseudolabrys sp.]
MLVCLCSRITLADNTMAMLVVSTERAGEDMALPERARRLLADVQQPAAIFTADGELMEAQPAGTALIGNRRDLIALGAEKLAREASLNGTAKGETLAGPASVIKLGAGPTFGLLVVFSGPATTSDTEHAGPKAATTPVAPSSPKLEAHPQYAPVRFVWQTDSGARFTLASLEFADLLGPKTATLLGHAWNDIARTLNLDPQDQIASALTARETFSGIVLFWPLDDFDERLPVEMSGLPVFDRDRQFKGFRGFGICRDLTRLEQIQQRRGGKAVPPPASRKAETKKIVPFPATPELQAQEQKFNVRDRSAFQELARELSERLKKSSGKASKPPPDDLVAGSPVHVSQPVREPAKVVQNAQDSGAIFDRLPIGILVYRLNNLIYANRVFLEWTGYATLDALNEAGGLDSLFIDSKDKPTPQDGGNGAKTLTIATINGTQKPVEGRLFSAMWNGENALVLMIDPRVGTHEKPIDISPDSVTRENRELKAILDTATDGVLMLDRTGRIIFANRSAEALFGYDSADFTEHPFGDLLAPESRRLALEHLDRLAHS